MSANSVPATLGSEMALPQVRGRLTRDVILFIFGLAGLVHETVVAALERPVLITAFLAMCGLPMFLRRDEKVAEQAPPTPPTAPATGPEVTP